MISQHYFHINLALKSERKPSCVETIFFPKNLILFIFVGQESMDSLCSRLLASRLPVSYPIPTTTSIASWKSPDRRIATLHVPGSCRFRGLRGLATSYVPRASGGGAEDMPLEGKIDLVSGDIFSSTESEVALSFSFRARLMESLFPSV